MRRVYAFAIVLMVLLSFVLTIRATMPTIQTGTWAPAGQMSVARAGAAAVQLPDGRVMIIGGTDASGAPTASAEFFGTDGTWSAAPPMSMPRAGHAAIWLADGEVLVTGGITMSGGGPTNSAETFDPLTGKWTALGSAMLAARSGHTMTQLLDGSVLIAGGRNNTGAVNTLEMVQLGATPQFSSIGTLQTGRFGHAADVLQDGRVLIVGGSKVDGDGNTVTLASTEIFDRATGVTAGPTLNPPRTGASVTTLLDGTVLIAGGSYPEGAAQGAPPELNNLDIFNPADGSLKPAPAQLKQARSGHQAFLLPHNANVLIVGGTYNGSALASVEQYTPWTGHIQPSTMAAARAAATGSSLNNLDFVKPNDGLIMIAGGNDASGTPQGSAELYRFATVTTDKIDYAPGQAVNITGSGWQPNEVVTLNFREKPSIDTPGPFTVQADANGNFTDNQFAPDANDLAVRFFLTAIGKSSGLQAQHTFTDKYPTVTIEACSPNPVQIGQATNCTATVSVNGQQNASLQGTITIALSPTGSGTLTLDANSCGTEIGPYKTLVCNFSYTPSASTSATFTATYSSSNNGGNGSSSTSDPLTVLTTPTTLTLDAPNPSTVASGAVGPVTFTAHLSTSGVAIVGRTVSFTVDGNAAGSATTDPSGTAQIATYNPSALIVGGHNVVASFAGDSTYTAATSDPRTLTVLNATTTTTVSSSVNPSTFGQSVTFTATVTGTGTPTGAVNFYDGGTCAAPGSTLASAVGLNGSGQASFSTSTLTPPSHTILACYVPTGTFVASNGSVTQTVNTAPTRVAIQSDSPLIGTTETSIFGQAVGLTATVSTTAPGAGTPSGTVDFIIYTVQLNFDSSGTPIGTATVIRTVAGVALNGSGIASIGPVTDLPIGGPRSVEALYHPTLNFAAGYATLVHAVVQDPTTTTVVSSSGVTSTYGDSVTFTATVTGQPPTSGPTGFTPSAPPSGTVSFYDAAAAGTCVAPGGSQIGSAASVSGSGASGTASVSTSSLSGTPSQHNILACYSGDTNYATSNGTTQQTVNKKTASVNLSGLLWTYDNTSKTAGATTTPTGLTVNLAYGSGTAACATANSLTAMTYDSTTGPTNAGCYTATGTIADNNYQGTATSDFVISKATSTTTVTGGTFVYDGLPHPATVSVTGAGGLSLTPTPSYSGTCSSAPITVAQGTGCTASYNYAGDANHDSSSGSATITITKSQVKVLVGSANPTYDGASKTVGVTVTPNDASSLVVLTYTSSSPSYNSTSGPINAGTYAATASLTDTANYQFTTDSVNPGTLTISKASSTTTVTFEAGPYTYRGTAFTATVTVTGAGGLNQLPAAVYSGDCTNVTVTNGCTASYSFAGDANHETSSDSKSITISKATSTTTVTGGTFVYDGLPHPATVSVTGVGGLSLTPAPSYSGTCSSAPITVAQGTACTASYNYAGDANHESSSGSATITITKAQVTVRVGSLTVTYDGTSKTVSMLLSRTAPVVLTYTSSSPSYNSTTGPTNAGTYTATASLTDSDNYEFTSASVNPGTLIINQASAGIALSVPSAGVQYSDPGLFGTTITFSTVSATSPGTGGVIFKVTSDDGLTNYYTSGPSQTALNAAGTAPWTSPPLLLAPGSYRLAVSFVSGNANYSNGAAWTAFQVTREDARVMYTGDLFVGVGSATTGPINLSATVRDISNPMFASDPASDTFAGDIRNATVTFVDRDNSNAVLCSSAVTLAPSLSDGTGTASCHFDGKVDSTGAHAYTIGIVVGNYYTRNDEGDDSIVSISQTGPGMITGGGYVVLDTTSAGMLNPTPGLKNNFGFNVKYNKSNTNLQGNINTIVRSTKDLQGQDCSVSHPGYTICVYQIKGNQLQSLGVSQWVPAGTGGSWSAGCPNGGTTTSPCQANFSGKANVQDITNPNIAPVPVNGSGNSILQVVMTDYGTGNIAPNVDTITFNLSGSAGVWFSTTPSPNQVKLGGGNLVVH